MTSSSRITSSPGTLPRRHRFVRATITTLTVVGLAGLAALASSDPALASQGPGGGLGTASHLTQVTMAIIVYGVSALVVGAGLVGIARQH